MFIDDNSIAMEMKLATGLAIITALFIHQLSTSPAIAHHTRELNDSTAGFSLQLVAVPELPGHSVRRGSDGFLYLQQRGLSSSAANLTSVRPAMVNVAVVVHVGSGMGPLGHELILWLSTTSSLTWLQCKPCNPMVKQKHPLFDPAKSTTYHAIPSSSPQCKQPPYQHEPGTGLCVFRIAGEGRIWARGYLSTDHFQINYGPVNLDYTFGCSHFTNSFGNAGEAAGILAADRSPTSFVMQAAARGLTNFSYCLSGETSSRGFLRFGDHVLSNPRYRTTEILPVHDAHDAAYYVSLVGVSLGGQRLDGVRPEMFARRENGQAGSIIDIGTPLTVLVHEAYHIVEEAVWSDLERHGAKRVEQTGYGLCVRATDAIKGRLQSMSLHFAEEEATLLVLPEQLFMMIDDDKSGRIACLAMTPGPRTIIGALQQVNTRFVYDLKDNKLSFAPESCIQDIVPVI